MENRQYDSVKALVRQLHMPNKNVARPHSDAELSRDEGRRRTIDLHSLPFLAVEKPHRKRASLFETGLKIPMLTVTSPNSPESPEHNPHHRFSFGHFRRHSHAVWHSKIITSCCDFELAFN